MRCARASRNCTRTHPTTRDGLFGSGVGWLPHHTRTRLLACGSRSSVDFPAERAVAVARGRVVQVPATDRGIALRGAPGGGPGHAGVHQLEPFEEPGELRL